LENHSRAILASGIFRSQDLPSYLSVLYSAVERYGSPEAIVTDGGTIFRANQALSIYEALNIDKEEIARGRPWQSYIRDHLQHPAQDGRLALRKGRELARARGHS
jgi:hypothetical protein